MKHNWYVVFSVKLSAYHYNNNKKEKHFLCNTVCASLWHDWELFRVFSWQSVYGKETFSDVMKESGLFFSFSIEDAVSELKHISSSRWQTVCWADKHHKWSVKQGRLAANQNIYFFFIFFKFRRLCKFLLWWKEIVFSSVFVYVYLQSHHLCNGRNNNT